MATKVTLFKGGSEEVTLPIGRVQIPDVWKLLESLGLNFNDPRVIDILRCWHIAGALKAHIQENDSP